MKAFCGLVLIGWCLSAAVVAAESTALDYEFQEKAQKGKVGVGEMLRRLRANITSTGAPADAADFDFRTVYAAAARHASAPELDELAAILRKTPPKFSGFDDCFSAYATAAIRQRIAGLAKKPTHIAWEPTAEPVPKELAAAPAGFQGAWRLHRTVMASYEAIAVPPEKLETPAVKLPPLETDLRRVVGHPEPEAWKHLALHVWGSWCGTGSEMLYHPRNRALLLSFLADGRLHEAAGAALCQVRSSFNFTGEGRPDFQPIELLTALGLDWEQVMLGSLLPIAIHDGVSGRAVFGYSFYEADAAQLLATRGSERAVRQCLDLIRWAKIEPQSAAEFLTLTLVPAEKRPDDSSFSSTTEPTRTSKLPIGIRQEILSVFREYLAPTNSAGDLVKFLDAIPTPSIKVLRQPIAALLSHPEHAVAAKALDLLQKEGLATGTEKIAPPLPSLRFRLLVNGKPLANARFSMEAFAKAEPKPPATGGTLLWSQPNGVSKGSQEADTNQDGGLVFSLAECVDPRSITTIRFCSGPPQYSPDLDQVPIPSISKPPEEGATSEWPGPWIVHEVAVRAGDEQVNEVTWQTADLEVRLASFGSLKPNDLVRMRLRRVAPASPRSPEQGWVIINAQVGRRVLFRGLQPGEYSIGARAPGAAHYESNTITVSNPTVVQEIQLEPGRNVRGTAVLPDGTKSSLPPIAKLTREGVEVSRYGEEWKGLPFGRYIARIRSTKEAEEAAKKNGFPPRKIAQEDRIEAREVSFTLDSSTPATLDLGEIKISREKR